MILTFAEAADHGLSAQPIADNSDVHWSRPLRDPFGTFSMSRLLFVRTGGHFAPGR
jgi:hypothetical protein